MIINKYNIISKKKTIWANYFESANTKVQNFNERFVLYAWKEKIFILLKKNSLISFIFNPFYDKYATTDK